MTDRISDIEFLMMSQDDQIARLRLAAMACLERYGLSSASEIVLLNHRENAVFSIVDDQSGAKFALRVHRAGYHERAAIASELAWMRALQESGIDTPELIRGLDGDYIQTVDIPELPAPHHCDLLDWVEGQSLSGAASQDVYAIMGAANARLHNHAKNWKLPEDFVRQRWDEDGMLGGDPVWGRFQDLAQMSDEQRSLLERARTKARERLQAFGMSEDRFGLIHADMMPENIMVKDEHPFLIDFDDSGFGWFLYDLGTLFAADAFEEGFQDNLAAWVKGYRTVEPLGDEDLAELPTFLMCRMLVGLGWLHTRKETPMAKEYTEFYIEHACLYANEYLKT